MIVQSMNKEINRFERRFYHVSSAVDIKQWSEDSAVEAYSPIAHGEILNQPEIQAMAEKYGVSVPQLCIRYTLQLGTISLSKTANPDHMKTNADMDFEISAEDMETLKNFKKIENYGVSSGFPVYGGRL
ncbi:aldo/keto reductases related to diketogulonate reductase [Clostridium sp. CAG:632]|jgi:diketogulonate reductase-like aldo/keto reductase|nr:aldo/keto reductases related to diketogulonate reductase [Clostridium sp. CAG:632]